MVSKDEHKKDENNSECENEQDDLEKPDPDEVSTEWFGGLMKALSIFKKKNGDDTKGD